MADKKRQIANIKTPKVIIVIKDGLLFFELGDRLLIMRPLIINTQRIVKVSLYLSTQNAYVLIRREVFDIVIAPANGFISDDSNHNTTGCLDLPPFGRVENVTTIMNFERPDALIMTPRSGLNRNPLQTLASFLNSECYYLGLRVNGVPVIVLVYRIVQGKWILIKYL